MVKKVRDGGSLDIIYKMNNLGKNRIKISFLNMKIHLDWRNL